MSNINSNLNKAGNSNLNLKNNVGTSSRNSGNYLGLKGKRSLTLILVGAFVIVFLAFIIILLIVLRKTRQQNKLENKTTVELIKYIHDCKNKPKELKDAVIPASTLGNEYNLSFWMYVNDYNYRIGELKTVLFRGPRTSEKDHQEIHTQANPGIYLDKFHNKLMFKFKLSNQMGDGQDDAGCFKAYNVDTGTQFKLVATKISIPIKFGGVLKTIPDFTFVADGVKTLITNTSKDTVVGSIIGNLNVIKTDAALIEILKNYLKSQITDDDYSTVEKIKTKLTELFMNGATLKTPIIVENFVLTDSKKWDVGTTVSVKQFTVTNKKLSTLTGDLPYYITDSKFTLGDTKAISPFKIEGVSGGIKLTDGTNYIQNDLTLKDTSSNDMILKLLPTSTDKKSFDDCRKDAVKNNEMYFGMYQPVTTDGKTTGICHTLTEDKFKQELAIVKNLCNSGSELDPDYRFGKDENMYVNFVKKDISEVECSINNFPLQRWNHVSINIHNNICDVFFDGKLFHTCVFDGSPEPTDAPFFLAYDGSATKSQTGFDGYLSNMFYSNRALTPGDIYKTYKRGPRILLTAADSIRSIFGRKPE
jgi:hypothetical protein